MIPKTIHIGFDIHNDKLWIDASVEIMGGTFLSQDYVEEVNFSDVKDVAAAVKMLILSEFRDLPCHMIAKKLLNIEDRYDNSHPYLEEDYDDPAADALANNEVMNDPLKWWDNK